MPNIIRLTCRSHLCQHIEFFYMLIYNTKIHELMHLLNTSELVDKRVIYQ